MYDSLKRQIRKRVFKKEIEAAGFYLKTSGLQTFSSGCKEITIAGGNKKY